MEISILEYGQTEVIFQSGCYHYVEQMSIVANWGSGAVFHALIDWHNSEKSYPIRLAQHKHIQSKFNWTNKTKAKEGEKEHG